ncbi:apolipoprotein N-acyltransferase [Melaminivora sp.]|uniref:apolipoprotein N-acyltransferase n=1 Tax=Melaminivora sp. TaxID=1933032 RepID=UPI0028AD63C9|nr:apolipoprotein N-acyltransferase [Melaminivora sp.]
MATPVLLQRGPAPWLLAAAAGGVQALSLALPLPGSGQPLWWLQVASLAVLAHLLLAAPPGRAGVRRAGLLGWLFATAWLCGTFWWLFISMHTYGGLAAPLAALAVLALAAFLGSYYGAACAAFRALCGRGALPAALLFAALWMLAELARGQWWTGFPWGAVGYAHVDGPLAVLARSVGVYGISFVAAALALLLARARARHLRSPRLWLGLAALLLAWAGLAWQRGCALQGGCAALGASADAGAPLTLALLQGNIPQDEKFQPGSGVPLALSWYGEQLRAAQAQLVVAPETAIPLLPQQLVPGYLEGIAQRFSEGGQAVLLGIPLGSPQEGYTNSAIGFAPGQEGAYRYDKHHLVPFGEFIPPLFKWFTQMMNIPLGDFVRGGVGQPSLAFAGQRLAPNICYEDLFGEELAARFLDPAQAPTVLVNLSNIGWFGDSIAIRQHLAISRLRALEFERPMVRATNTGATAVIDHQGRVTHQLAPHTRAVLAAEVQGRAGDATPYARWAGRWGLAPLWLAGLGIVLLAWLRRARA